MGYLLYEGAALETLKYLFIGAEKLSLPLVKRGFAAVTPGCRLFNMYGPTEATIISAVLEIHESDDGKWENLSSVPIGKAIANASLAVLDEHSQPCPIDVPGELIIGGDGLARGYLNQPELTAEKFYRSYKSYRTYKTGDLSQWLPDGNIEFLGRIDHQVKIRGFRIELGEIENCLLKHNEVKEAIVTALEDSRGEPFLCAYVMPGEVDVEGLVKHLERVLPDYMIPSYIVPLADIPLTATGKVDRSALPAPDINRAPAGMASRVSPRDEIEQKLAEIWAKGLGLEQNSIGIDDHFFKRGGHSLKATLVSLVIHKTFNVELTLEKFLEIPTIRELAAYIKQASTGTGDYRAVQPAEKKEYYMLSPAQKRFYFLHSLDPRSPAYNIFDVYMLNGPLDEPKMEHTFKTLIQRHESLRTSFQVVGSDAVQKIHDEIDFKIRHYEAKQNPAPKQELQEIIEGFIGSFDLARAPLFRVGLIRLTGRSHLFLFDMHHIIGDAVSIELFVSEFMTIYSGRHDALPELTMQYKDFSEWHNRWILSGEMKRQEAYWLDTFAGEIPVTRMPTDYDRPAAQSFEGDNISFEITAGEAAKLRAYAAGEGATLFMTILALFYVFLYKISGQDDLVVGTPVAGRKHPEFYDIIGIFINTVALRNFPNEDKTFAEFLRDVKTGTLEAFANQDYPFEHLVRKVWKNKQDHRNPLFDVLYTFRGHDRKTLRLAASENGEEKDMLELHEYPHPWRRSIMDLVLTVLELDDQQELHFNLGYSTALFKHETIEQFIGYFKEITAAVAANKHVRLKDIDVSHELGTAAVDVPQINFGF
jgi:acyl carrier protein/NRPS condensation-like uncharacterized protein